MLLTGHTGFKGAWLSLWLHTLGARVTGLSLGVPTEPSLYELARVERGMHGSVMADIRDPGAVESAIAGAHPEIVIHMAAQPLVRRSFAEPRLTYDTNVMGTVNVLDAVRACEGVRAVVIVTSDKCYVPSDSPRGHRESDPLGGHDPYSSSKACAELVTAAYRHSFFSDPSAPRVASARAGNVIGGGDWGAERLIPDIVRAAIGGETLRLRNPSSVRPWQHVLSPLSGYLVLAQALYGSSAPHDSLAPHDSPDYASAWNFGPEDSDVRTVEWVVGRIAELWPGGLSWERDENGHPHEAHHLKLDSARARMELGWRPTMGLEQGIEATVAWYQALRDGANPRTLTLEQIERHSS